MVITSYDNMTSSNHFLTIIKNDPLKQVAINLHKTLTVVLSAWTSLLGRFDFKRTFCFWKAGFVGYLHSISDRISSLSTHVSFVLRIRKCELLPVCIHIPIETSNAWKEQKKNYHTRKQTTPNAEILQVTPPPPHTPPPKRRAWMVSRRNAKKY